MSDANGYALYRLEFDAPGAAPISHESWPALLAPDEPTVSPGISAFAEMGVSGHLLINGFPVYRHAADSQPGEARGQGAASVWWLINPDGSLNTVTESGGPGGDPGYGPPDDSNEPPPGYNPGLPPSEPGDSPGDFPPPRP